MESDLKEAERNVGIYSRTVGSLQRKLDASKPAERRQITRDLLNAQSLLLKWQEQQDFLRDLRAGEFDIHETMVNA